MPPDLAASTGFLLGKVGASVTRRLANALSLLGLRQKHFAVLALLEDSGSCAQQSVAARLNLDPSGLVSVIDDLRRRGAVERERDPEDRRRHTVRLTEVGRALLAECRELVASVDAEWLAPLSEEQRRQLHAILLRLAEADPVIPSPRIS
ncbi:hypothetical protein TH66_14155 [Carbonactinospora thermoautotrophica]|uniref:HTH marR-type domain-containing protein n=1 Tax=Carbonactinospora thermoautotrophica TaxID=1469144 RepID=A0A132MT04_9ACTN|nr:hypothetical protein TH66_14155 [Carbonactinospora thermoautotrophica]KWX09117.1 hypothetical protein TR74_11550 [Carbonactinospora thermoautotrophica]